MFKSHVQSMNIGCNEMLDNDYDDCFHQSSEWQGGKVPVVGF